MNMSNVLRLRVKSKITTCFVLFYGPEKNNYLNLRKTSPGLKLASHLALFKRWSLSEAKNSLTITTTNTIPKQRTNKLYKSSIVFNFQ